LANPHPLDYLDMLRKRWIGFACKCRGNDLLDADCSR
jgi:hypothetical protein